MRRARHVHQLLVGQLLMGMRELTAQAMLEHGGLWVKPVLGVQRRHPLLGAAYLARHRIDDRHPLTGELQAAGFGAHEPEALIVLFWFRGVSDRSFLSKLSNQLTSASGTSRLRCSSGSTEGKCQPKQSVLSSTRRVAVPRTETGGRISCDSTCCTSVRRCPIPWAETSTTPRSSRAWTWRP
jgi:hypothetical protein